MKLNKNDRSEFIDFYNNVNPLYSAIYPTYVNHNKTLAESIIRNSDFKNISTVADLGCGTSNVLYEMAIRFPDKTFIGIDFSPVTIDLCNELYVSKNLFFICAEWDEGLIDWCEKYNKKIDLALCLGNTICHYQNEEQIAFVELVKSHLTIKGNFIFDSYKEWNSRLHFNDFVFEPKYLTETKENKLIHSAFFTKYTPTIALRNILITVYDEYNNPPIQGFHFKTWQFPLKNELLDNQIKLEDGLGFFSYFKLSNYGTD